MVGTKRLVVGMVFTREPGDGWYPIDVINQEMDPWKEAFRFAPHAGFGSSLMETIGHIVGLARELRLSPLGSADWPDNQFVVVHEVPQVAVGYSEGQPFKLTRR